MLETIESINNVVNNFIWGVPAMICIIGVGLVLSFRTRFLQIRKFPYAMKVTIGRMFRKKQKNKLKKFLTNEKFCDKINELIRVGTAEILDN